MVIHKSIMNLEPFSSDLLLNHLTCKLHSGLFSLPDLVVNPPYFFSCEKCFSRILQTSNWLANLCLNVIFKAYDADGVFVWSAESEKQESWAQVSNLKIPIVSSIEYPFQTGQEMHF